MCFKEILSRNQFGFKNGTAQKMKFSIKDFISKCNTNLQTFTEEILNGKLHFLCSVGCCYAKNWNASEKGIVL